MSGLDIIAAQLAAHAPLTARVPLTKIKVSTIEEGTAGPFITFESVSRLEMSTVARGPRRHWTQRVQVNVFATSARERGDLLDLVRAACLLDRGDVAGATEVSITLGVEGPGIFSEQGLFIQAQDFAVGFNTAA